jgi:RNA polymerase sigma-70 factor (ECF subfamily)
MLENVLRDESDRLTTKKRAAARERRVSTSFILNLDEPRPDSRRSTTFLEQEERRAWIHLALELLRPEDRQVLRLREFEDLSFPRIAESLGVSEDAARMRYNRAMVRLEEKVRTLHRGELEGLFAGGT